MKIITSSNNKEFSRKHHSIQYNNYKTHSLSSTNRKKSCTNNTLYKSSGIFISLIIVLVCICAAAPFFNPAYAGKILIYMDINQTDHLRAYGLTYWCLERGMKAEWLLNYHNGSFVVPDIPAVRERAAVLGVSYTAVDESAMQSIYGEIAQQNMERIYLDTAPKIAVYVPPTHDPWDDAVTMVLEYAQISYDKLYDEEILLGKLTDYDWLHLHHEDFTGQYGKFYASFHNADWYQKRVTKFQQDALKLGYKTVREEKLAVAQAITAYVNDGGFLFAMCSACDSFDIALAAAGLDIIPAAIDGTPITPDAQQKINYSKCLAFENFNLIFDPMIYEFSDIDIDVRKEGLYYNPDTFTLFEFSAKYDPIPAMLTQNHEYTIKGFLGQTTAFQKHTIKENVTILGETSGSDRVKYIHGDLGKGTWTFYAGHDPEDYMHLVGDPPTDLSLHKNSPGYRLILNNILFPAARKKEQKT